MPSDLSRQLNLSHSVSNKNNSCNFPTRPSQIFIIFSQNVHNVLEHAVQNFAAIFSVFVSWQNFKDVRRDPVYRYLQIAS